MKKIRHEMSIFKSITFLPSQNFLQVLREHFSLRLKAIGMIIFKIIQNNCNKEEAIRLKIVCRFFCLQNKLLLLALALCCPPLPPFEALCSAQAHSSRVPLFQPIEDKKNVCGSIFVNSCPILFLYYNHLTNKRRQPEMPVQKVSRFLKDLKNVLVNIGYDLIRISVSLLCIRFYDKSTIFLVLIITYIL
jgi:hypothetical protein